MARKKNIKYVKKSEPVFEPENLVLKKEEPKEVLKKEEVKKNEVLIKITDDRDIVSKLFDEGYKVTDQTIKDGKLVYTLHKK